MVIWSVVKRKRLRSNRMLSHPSAVTFSPDGESFLIKSTRGEMLLCDTATADPLSRFVPRGHDEGAAPVFANTDRIIDGSWSGEIRARDVTHLTPQVLWSDAHRMVTQVMHSSDRWVYVVNATVTHPCHERGAALDQLLIAEGPDSSSLRVLERQWPMLRSAALSPNGDRVAVRYGGPHERVEIVSLDSGLVVAAASTIAGGTGHRLSWSLDGRILVLVEKAGFSLRDANDLAEVGRVASEYPAHVSFSRDGQLVAFGDWSNGFVRSWPAMLSELVDAHPLA